MLTSEDIENRIVLSDNLEALRSIQESSIDLIYSDILYGTGRKFDAYQDIKSDKQEVLYHYEPRISEMKRVLKKTGQIYLQMDWRIVHWIRCIMDDVFGYNNFRNEIIWQYHSAPRTKNAFSKRHDTILRYSKSGKYYFDDTSVREPYMKNNPISKTKEEYYNKLGKVIGDVWTDIPMLPQKDRKERVGYPTQKPIALMERIILSSSKPGDLVADFYCGSGTTCVTSKMHGRKYFGVDSSTKAYLMTQRRLMNT